MISNVIRFRFFLCYVICQKYYFWLSILLVFLFYSCKQKKPFTEYYSDGNIWKVTESVIDGKLHGKAIEYYKSGRIKSEYFYNNGLKEGIGLIFFENGNIMQKSFFKNGLEEKLVTGFYVNGNNKFTIEFENGRKHGKASYFNLQGYLIEEREYFADTLHGIFNWYDSLGSLMHSQLYSNGHLKKQSKYSKSNALLETTFFVYLDSLPLENMKLLYTREGTIDSIKSFYAEVEYPDTVEIGEPLQLEVRLKYPIKHRNISLVVGDYLNNSVNRLVLQDDDRDGVIFYKKETTKLGQNHFMAKLIYTDMTNSNFDEFNIYLESFYFVKE